MATIEVSSGGNEKGNNRLTDKMKKENEVANTTVGREDNEYRNGVPTSEEIKKTGKRKLSAQEDKYKKNGGSDMLDMEINEECVKEIKKVKKNSPDKGEIEEEYMKKKFFDVLNKKKKTENYDPEVHKTSHFVIHYYDWNDIPDLCNLPYDLINKENDDLYKKYKTNYLMFLSYREKAKKDELEAKDKKKQEAKEEEKQKGEDNEKEEGEEKGEDKEKEEDEEKGEDKEKEEGEEKGEDIEKEEDEKKGEDKEKEKEEEETEADETDESKSEKSETDDSKSEKSETDESKSEKSETIENKETEKDAEECVYKKFMSILLYEDIKKHFSKKKRKDIEVSTLKKAKSFAFERPEKGEIETYLEQKGEMADVKTKRETDAEIQMVEKEEANWTMDFVALTNIQILGKHSNQLNDWKTIEILLPQIIECCCSPRSSVCKNSFLAIKHLCISWKNKKVLLNNLFVHIFPFVIKKLDVKNNFLKNCVMTAMEEFMLYGNTVNNYEMLRLICNHSNNKNAIITKQMAYYVYSFLKNLPKKKLKQIPLTELATPFVNFLHAKLEVTRKYIKQVFSLLLKVKTQEEIIECFKNGISKKENFKIIEMSIRNILDQESNGNGPPLKRSYSSFHEFRTMQRMGSVHHFSSN